MNGYSITSLAGVTTAYTGTVNLTLAGTNTRGGSNYFDFLSATNTTVGATTPSKTFRLNNAGQLQIINHAYTSQLLLLDDTGNVIIPGSLTLNGGLNYRSFSGFYFVGSGSAVTLTASQNGYLIQLGGANVILPLGSAVGLGGTFTFANNSGSNITITVNNTGTEFIYNGGNLGTSTRSITIQPAETLEIMSRGNTEWDVTGGTATLRYQGTPPVLKTSAANQAAGTTISMNTLKAYMSSAGALWLGSNTGGAINVYGQGQWTYYGAAGAGSTIELVGLTSLTSAAATPGQGRQGDLITAVVTDTTNSITYRVTGQQTGAAVTGNYTIVIEQIA